MEKKRSIGVLVLTGLLIGAASSPIVQMFFFGHFCFSPSFEILIYLISSLIVFNKWSKLAYWQKGIFWGIGIQSILLFISLHLNLFLNVVNLDNPLNWLIANSNTILSPLEDSYLRFMMPYREILIYGQRAFQFNVWEGILLFPLFRILYSGILGFIIAKLIEKIFFTHIREKSSFKLY